MWKWRRFRILQVLEEGAWHAIQGGIWEETWGRLIQTGGILREDEDLGGKWLCWEFLWIEFHWCVWMALGHSQEGRKRTCRRDQPYHTGAPGQGVHRHLWDVEAPGKYEVEEFIRLFYERFSLLQYFEYIISFTFWKIFISLFLGLLGGSSLLHGLFSSCSKQGLLLIAVRGLPLLWSTGPRSTGFSNFGTWLSSCGMWP